jgi:adenine deaminase
MNPDSGLTSTTRGLEPADLILSNAKIVNVFTAEIEQGNIAIFKGWVAGTGDYRQAGRTIDLKGTYTLLGLISGHVHNESSMVERSMPGQ